MDENPVIKEELGSELTGFNKGEKEERKKQIMFTIIGTIIFIILCILVIILVSNTESNKSKDKNDEEEDVKKIIVGEINCIYDIGSSSQNTALLGKEFNKNSEFDIYVDGKIIKFSKEYKFESVGIHNVSIKLYGDINMDNMFKDVEDLNQIELISENNCQITSMISTFENCFNLYNFTVIGFGADKLKSMKKLFYRTRLYFFSFKSFDTKNLEVVV